MQKTKQKAGKKISHASKKFFKENMHLLCGKSHPLLFLIPASTGRAATWSARTSSTPRSATTPLGRPLRRASSSAASWTPPRGSSGEEGKNRGDKSQPGSARVDLWFLKQDCLQLKYFVLSDCKATYCSKVLFVMLFRCFFGETRNGQ